MARVVQRHRFKKKRADHLQQMAGPQEQRMPLGYRSNSSLIKLLWASAPLGSEIPSKYIT